MAMSRREREARLANNRRRRRSTYGKPKRRKSKVTMGKMFRTRKGKYGCYKYVNGKRVAFVRKSKR